MIFITPVNMPVPCQMVLCHNLSKFSIHDLEGREQTGIIICEKCLREIVEAGQVALGTKEAVLPFEPTADEQVAALEEVIEIYEQIIEEEKPSEPVEVKKPLTFEEKKKAAAKKRAPAKKKPVARK